MIPSAGHLELVLRVILGRNARNNFLRIIRDYDRSDDDVVRSDDDVVRSDDDDRDNYDDDDDQQ